MGFFSKLFGTAGDAIAQPVEAIGNVFDKLFTSDEERAQAQFVMEKLKQHPYELQAEINKLEAQHRSVFVAGWRPFIGWICGFSLACYFIPQAILINYIWVKACLTQSAILPFPTLQGLLDIIFAMLGLGVMRSAEKFGGKTK